MNTTTYDVNCLTYYGNESALQQLQYWYCAVPGFCALGSSYQCSNITFYGCSHCYSEFAVLYIVVAIILCLAILLGNLIIQWAFLFGGREMRNTMSEVRFSLSISDLMMGVMMAIVLIPNSIWTLLVNGETLNGRTCNSRDSPEADIGGTLFMLNYTSSLNHLILMALYRFAAIRWPLRYRMGGRKWITIPLLMVWVLALISATVPALFKTYLTYLYFPPAFLYLPAVRPLPVRAELTHPVASLVITFTLPYLAMTVILVATVVQLHHTMKKSNDALERQCQSRQNLNRQREVVKTIGMMYFSFTAAILPLTITMALTYIGKMHCSGMSLSFMISTLLAISNSAVNVIVYSAREQQFRKLISSKLESLRLRICKQKTNSGSRTKSTQL